jgi:teichoic acid transport system permease protein
VTDGRRPSRARLSRRASAAGSADLAPDPARPGAAAPRKAGGRVSAPGRLRSDQALAAGSVLTADLPDQPLGDYARAHGLRPSAERPHVLAYIYQLWRRRHFIVAFATARNIAMYTEAKLGQLWQVLTPLLNVGVYWLIFGEILNTSKGIPKFISFLVVGVFVFNFTQRAFISTSTVITDSLPLIRALQFPRASLPLAYVMIELQQMFLSMGVLIVIILISGEPVSWYWLLAIPILALQTIFNVGVGMFVARLGSQVNDFSQLLPFLLRTWMYLSGVLFSILTLAQSTFGKAHPLLVTLMQVNPAALYITLMRLALLQSARASAPGSAPANQALCALWKHATSGQALYDSRYCPAVLSPDRYWYYAVGWAVFALVAGFVFFWRAEVKYGRG